MTITTAAGESFYRDVYVWNDLSHTEPHDITDATVDFRVYDRPNGNQILAGGAQIIDPEKGQILVILEAGQTVGKAGSVLHYVVTLREAIGTTTIVDSGKLKIVGAASLG